MNHQPLRLWALGPRTPGAPPSVVGLFSLAVALKPYELPLLGIVKPFDHYPDRVLGLIV